VCVRLSTPGTAELCLILTAPSYSHSRLSNPLYTNRLLRSESGAVIVSPDSVLSHRTAPVASTPDEKTRPEVREASDSNPSPCSWISHTIPLLCTPLFFEVSCLVISACAIIATVVVLKLYDGLPIPEWSSEEGTGLTLNAMFSQLSTLSRSCLVIPLDEALGQLMWLVFTKQEGRRLAEAKLYNAASRGRLTSALMLIVRKRGRWAHLRICRLLGGADRDIGC